MQIINNGQAIITLRDIDGNIVNLEPGKSVEVKDDFNAKPYPFLLAVKAVKKEVVEELPKTEGETKEKKGKKK